MSQIVPFNFDPGTLLSTGKRSRGFTGYAYPSSLQAEAGAEDLRTITCFAESPLQYYGNSDLNNASTQITQNCYLILYYLTANMSTTFFQNS